MIRHHRHVHLVEEKPFKCYECGMSYTRKDRLNNHIASVHSKEINLKSQNSDKMEYAHHIRTTVTHNIRPNILNIDVRT